jgi:hypothetical protein
VSGLAGADNSVEEEFGGGEIGCWGACIGIVFQ